MKSLTFFSILVFSLFSASLTWADRGYNNNDWHWHMMDYMMGGGWFMWLFFIIIIGILVYFIISLSQNRGGTGFRTQETPLDILKRRYAGGEITKEEYEEKKRDLGY